MNFLTCLESKRDGNPLPPAELKAAVQAFTEGTIPDYQMAAFLMAVCFQGLNEEETRCLTLAMRDSGQVLTWSPDGRPVVDKHSTGGVGDKVSLPLAPLLACLGFRVPMISGRGLGITGGTLDKLESMPGFTTTLSPRRLIEQVQAIGVAMAGQSETMVPADRKLYALRDVTGTVPSIPLITASILAKKLAEGLEALILDVKYGGAAFMRDRDRARRLAESMVTLGRACGLKVKALLTNMDRPLGRSAGHWLEVLEAVACLRNEGPEDLRALVVECAAHLLTLTGREPDIHAARGRADEMLASGAPYEKWKALVMAQGGDPLCWTKGPADRWRAPTILDVPATRHGTVTRCDARIIGEVVRELGGGRFQQKSVLRHEVGVDAMRKPGERVAPGGLLCRVHACDHEAAVRAVARLQEAYVIEELVNTEVEVEPLIAEVVD